MFLNEKCKSLKVNYIISDSNEPGEGEHKIMKYMDTLNKDSINVVYGLDADLIMLSMIRNHTVYLLLLKGRAYNIEDLDTDYIFLNINLLKKISYSNYKKTIF